MNCFRYFGITNIDDIDKMTLTEYKMRIKAHKYKMVDDEYLVHKQAWAGQQVKATKQVGKKQKPYFEKFGDFFNREEMEEQLFGVKQDKVPEKFKRLALIGKQMNNRRKEVNDGS